MDRIKKYRTVIKEFLLGETTKKPSNAPKLERHLIIDQAENQFLLLTMGWYEEGYKHYAVFHLEIKDAKIWLHQNSTDIDIGEYFVKKGIAKSEMILGFLEPFERELSEYAVA